MHAAHGPATSACTCTVCLQRKYICVSVERHIRATYPISYKLDSRSVGHGVVGRILPDQIKWSHFGWRRGLDQGLTL